MSELDEAIVNLKRWYPAQASNSTGKAVRLVLAELEKTRTEMARAQWDGANHREILRDLAASNPWQHRGAHLTCDTFTCDYCVATAELAYGEDKMVEEPHADSCVWRRAVESVGERP